METKKKAVRGRTKWNKKKRAKQTDPVASTSAHWFEIVEILRKAEMVATGGETKYLVSWPNTWEPANNLKHCSSLLDAFEAGLSQDTDSDDNDNDRNEMFPSEWIVKKIIGKRYVRGKPSYNLQWGNSWVNAKDIRPELIKQFEQKMEQEKVKPMDTNNNQDKPPRNKKRKRSTSVNENWKEANTSQKIPKPSQLDEKHPKNVIEVKLITSTERRKLDKIRNIGLSDDGQFTFLLKFKTGEYGLIKRELANEKYPQEVIAFYEQRIRLD